MNTIHPQSTSKNRARAVFIPHLLLAAAILIGAGTERSGAAVILNGSYEASPNAGPFTPTWETSIIPGDILYSLSALGTQGVLAPATNGASGPCSNPTGANLFQIGGGGQIAYAFAATALSSIDVYGGWQDSGRDDLSFSSIEYSTDGGSTYLTLTATAYYNPSVTSSLPVASRLSISDDTGSLAGGNLLTNLPFNFTNGKNGGSGYSEFAAYAIPKPSTAASLPVGLAALAGLRMLRRRRT